MNHRRTAVIALMLYALTAPPVGWAEVLNSTDQGFIIRHEFNTPLPAARVYQTLSGEVGQWWSADHTYSGDAANMHIDARAGGCFCETWGDQQVQHLQVVAARPPHRLRLTGGLGPLQQEAVAGVMDWQIQWDEAQQHSHVVMVYKVSGYRPDGMSGWAAPVNQVLGEQVERLHQHLAIATTQ